MLTASPSSPSPSAAPSTSYANLARSLRPLCLPPWIPHSPYPKQLAAMMAPQGEVLYGGAAGGGKTDALLMCALQYSEHPNYRGIIFRRTYPQLAQAGGLIERSREWLTGKGPTYNATERCWTFPAGGKLFFRHMDGDGEWFAHQGAEYHFVAWDELTHWPDDRAYRYLMSRLRRASDDPIPLRVVATSNPGGMGHAWVKDRFLTHGGPAQGRLFIPANLSDNPALDRDEYTRQLGHLHPTERARLLHGDWDVTDDGLIRREWIRTIRPEALPAGLRWRRAWDLAASERASADETASVRGALGPDGTLYLAAPIAGRWAWPEARQIIARTAEAEAEMVREVGVEQVAAWRATVDDLATAPIWLRVALRRLTPHGDKLACASPWAARAASGRVVVVEGWDWSGWLDQWTSFPGARHDDRVDAVSRVAEMLTSTATGWLGAFGGR